LRLQQLLILLHSSIGSAQRRGRRVGVFHSLQGYGGRGCEDGEGLQRWARLLARVAVVSV
jgi:hypothetical protein